MTYAWLRADIFRKSLFSVLNNTSSLNQMEKGCLTLFSHSHSFETICLLMDEKINNVLSIDTILSYVRQHIFVNKSLDWKVCGKKSSLLSIVLRIT